MTAGVQFAFSFPCSVGPQATWCHYPHSGGSSRGAEEALSQSSPEWMCAVDRSMTMPRTPKSQTPGETAKPSHLVGVPVMIVCAENVQHSCLLPDTDSPKMAPSQRLLLLRPANPASFLQLDALLICAQQPSICLIQMEAITASPCSTLYNK